MTLAFPRPERAKPDPAYLADVRRLPCIICLTDVDVVPHHAIDGRHSQSRADDRDAIALCPRCHRWRHDKPADFAMWHGTDAGLIAQTRAAVERLRRDTIGGRG